MKNPFQIEESSLSDKIRLSLLYDVSNGVVTNAVKHMVGFEFEQVLYSKLNSFSISYLVSILTIFCCGF